MGNRVHDHRKPLLFGSTVVAAVLVLSSVAYACVQTRGKISVTGDNGQTSTAVGNGRHPGDGNYANFIFCKPGKYLKAGAVSGSDQGAGRGDFTVRLGLPPRGCEMLEPNAQTPWITNTTTPNVFPDGNYEVNFCQGQNGEPVFTGPPITEKITLINTPGSCFFSDGVTDYGTLVGTMTVTNNTAGPATFGVPFGSFPTDPGTYAGVAVRRTGPTSCMCGPPPVNLAPIAMI